MVDKTRKNPSNEDTKPPTWQFVEWLRTEENQNAIQNAIKEARAEIEMMSFLRALLSEDRTKTAEFLERFNSERINLSTSTKATPSSDELPQPSPKFTNALTDSTTAEALFASQLRVEQKLDQFLSLWLHAQPVAFHSVGEKADKPMTFKDIPERTPATEAPLAQKDVTLHIEVDENPLTIEQLGTLFTTLTRLVTKYWLISQGRFDDLIAFSRTHDPRFIREAQAEITRLSYNSPFNFDIKLSATDVAQGMVTTIDGLIQVRERFKQMELATDAKAQELRQAEQRFQEETERVKQQDTFEQEKRQLDLERQRLEVERLRLEVEQQRLQYVGARLEAQRKNMEHAFELAHTVIMQLHPDADDSTKRILMQTYVDDILQLSGISFKSVTVIQADSSVP
jgi:hypothetical protein